MKVHDSTIDSTISEWKSLKEDYTVAYFDQSLLGSQKLGECEQSLTQLLWVAINNNATS